MSKANASTQQGNEDKKTYYEVTSATGWTVVGKVGSGVPADERALIQYNFENMVLAATIPTVQGVVGGGTPFRLTGGESGDNSVVFALTPDEAVPAETVLTLDLGTVIAISPDAPVSVKRTIALPGLSTVLKPRAASYTGAVAVAPALSVKATAKSPTAAVADGFKRFVTDPATVGDLGTLTITAKPHLKAADGAEVSSIGELIKPGAAASGNTRASASLFELEGNFSFATALTLADVASCPDPAASNLLVRDKETMEVLPIVVPLVADALSGLSYNRRLCIYVRPADDKDAVSIPATSPYMAVMDFAATDDDQLRTLADRTLNLGRIRRDGTTVHLPYVTTYEGYNQRITLSNRSGSRARYEFSFRPEDTVDASPGSMATGMLAAGQTVILKAKDVVTLTGGFRTAATVSVVAQPTDIDISSTLVDLDTGVAALTVHLSDNGLGQQ